MRAMMAAAAGLFLLGAAPAATKVEDFAWLAGTWVSEEGAGRWTEERWSAPRGGVMLGTSLSGEGKEAGWYEFMRIAAGADGHLAFHASPGGAPASAFPLLRAGKREAVFENLAHDYPTRIEYRREGNVLIATISAPGGVRMRTWRSRKRG